MNKITRRRVVWYSPEYDELLIGHRKAPSLLDLSWEFKRSDSKIAESCAYFESEIELYYIGEL